MKLIRFGEPGKERPGVLLEDGSRIDVSAFTSDFDPGFFASEGPAALRQWLTSNRSQYPKVAEGTRLGPPVANPSKLICIGLNYSDHARESNMSLPFEPVLFMKSTSSICGPNDPLLLPRGSVKTDWEVELAIVIGRKGLYIDEQDASEYIAGYLLHNDYSERAYQLERQGQWVKGKSFDHFAPLGPFLVTPDEIPDPSNLRLWLTVNGQIKQDGNSSNLVFKIPYLIAYISQFMTLLPGDIITTGTPAGVGLGQKPEPQYLKEGDVVELGIDGLGSSKQVAITYDTWKNQSA